MKEENKSADKICKAVWTVAHKASADGQQVDIVVSDGEKIAFSIMNIPVSKATPATIEEIERKVSEAFQKLQEKSNGEQEHELELHVGMNEITGAQEVYLSGKNDGRRLIVSSADYEE